MRGDDVIARLVEGNRRFVAGNLERRDIHVERMQAAAEHRPRAVVVGCSDARVPSEALFDVPVGTLFVVRTAGHVLAEASEASVRFATEILGADAVLVLGHEHCGAVTAVMEGTAPAWLDRALTPIREVRMRLASADIESVTEAHVRTTMARLREVVALDAAHEEPPRVTGGVYRLDSGQVDWLE